MAAFPPSAAAKGRKRTCLRSFKMRAHQKMRWPKLAPATHTKPKPPMGTHDPLLLVGLTEHIIQRAKTACQSISSHANVSKINNQKSRPLRPTEASQPHQADERTTRHLRLCAELADLAMQLARAAAARTLADWAEPEETQAAEPQSNQPAEPLFTQPAEPPFTQAAEPPSTEAAQPHADRETAPHANRAPTPHHSARTAAAKQTDPAILFTRLAAVVRDCISLEARLAAAPATTPDATARTLRADPRRAPLREAVRMSIENHPDRAALTRDITAHLDEQLSADPGQTIDPLDLLDALCEEFGIEIDFATLPDACLFASSATTNQTEYAPDPRATSPP